MRRGPHPITAPSPLWAPIDAILFYLLSSAAWLYLGWILVVERHLFPRWPLLPGAAAYFGFAWYFYAGSRTWLRRSRSRRATLGLAALCVLGSGVAVVGTLPLAALSFLAFRGLDWASRAPGPPSRWWSGWRRLVVMVALFGVLAPAMNRTYMLNGLFFLLGRREPPRMMENALYEVNVEGFRGPRVPVARPGDGRLRLLFTGDSTTFGFPYRWADAYPARVGALLGARGAGPVEVIDTALPSQSLVQISANLDRDLAYQPDALFVMSGIQLRALLEHRRRIERFRRPLLDLREEWIFVPPFVWEILKAGPWDTWWGLASDRAHLREPDANLPVYAETLEEVCRRVRARGVRLVLLDYPALALDPRVRQIELETARREGVDFLPLAQLVTREDQYAFRDRIHPDREGHERIAEAIADWVAREVQPGRPPAPASP